MLLDKIEKIRNSFRNKQLYIESLNLITQKIEWKPISSIMKHDSQRKDIFEIKGENKSVIVTEDHSLFNWNTIKEIKSSKLNNGDEIISKEDKTLKPLKINIKKVESRKYMYDLSVPGNENFFLSSGILAHNSYSISGVSLDLEKSSKYLALKDNFVNEFDKVTEAAKRSIKIIKGLRQMRYGIGITSALGPVTAPGTLSRRNWISGGIPTYV